MPLIRTYGDIFASRAQTLTCPVNCVGVMGKGLAKATKERYPEVYRQYRDLYEQGLLSLEWLRVVYTDDGRQVLLFPTKRHWSRPSRVEWIEQGLQQLRARYQDLRIESLALPMLGCGAGGLSYPHDVQPLIWRYLADLPIPIEVYEPPDCW